MFILKKILTPFFLPLSISMILFFSVVICFILRRNKTASWLLTIGIVYFVISGYGFFYKDFLWKYERIHPVLNIEKIVKEQSVKWICVLGGGVSADKEVPVTSRLSTGTLIRLIEGIRIHRLINGSKIILSGGKVFGPVSEALVMKELALGMGVNEENILLEENSRDTDDQAVAVKAIVGSAPLILVTSAYHMNRSMLLFRKAGMTPISSPIGFLVSKKGNLSPGMFFPSATNLETCEKITKEILGLIWSKIIGQI
ncbi:MAG: hypothetical protein ACD_79C01093G0001 [uncultured bacterium]|nr:MAG: hypothetical protein ACD_79C01093G0001 [uncultured bacterium]